MTLSIIIVSYNVKDFLRQALLSVRRALDGAPAEIIVVDNASEDGSAEMVLAEFDEVRVIENAENRGLAGANNQALRLARGRFIVLLNPDTVVQENTFTAVRAFFDSAAGRDAGMVGCKILNPDGTLQLAVDEHRTRRLGGDRIAHRLPQLLQRRGVEAAGQREDALAALVVGNGERGHGHLAP